MGVRCNKPQVFSTLNVLRLKSGLIVPVQSQTVSHGLGLGNFNGLKQ